jgi:hypothetical protein
MYGLPADFDPTLFLGRELEQVSFTANTVHLTFDGDASITILDTFEVRLVQGAAPVRQTPPVEQSNLMGLLGRRVVSAHRTATGTMALAFEQGGELLCMDESTQYESYTIRIGGREIVV